MHFSYFVRFRIALSFEESPIHFGNGQQHPTTKAMQKEAKYYYDIYWADKNLLSLKPQKITEEEMKIKEEKRQWFGDTVLPEELDIDYHEPPDPNFPTLSKKKGLSLLQSTKKRQIS